MLKLISKNPFRILGVFADAPTKEIQSNLNKTQAFIKVGKSVEFFTDFDLSFFKNGKTAEKNTLIQRDTETLNSAIKSIELTKDKIKSWMFWFVNQSQIDKIAFNHIVAGDFDKALDIWTKVDNMSSIHNRMIVYLMKEDWFQASITAGNLFNNYHSEICSGISDTLNLNSDELISIFFSSIEEEERWIIPQIYTDIKKSGLLTENENWVDIIKRKYANQEVEHINKAIKKSKSEKRDDANLMKFYAAVYTNNGNLHRLEELLGKDSQDYLSIASKVATEALQCIIDYYNYSLNQDDIAEEIYVLMNKVFAIAPIGSMARQRCQENIETIKNIIDKLPPKVISYYHKLLQARINAYDNESSTINGASQFLKDCAPYLMSIKNCLGIKNEYYINISTKVASAIVSDVIEDFNRQSEKLLPKIKNSSGNSRDIVLRQFKSVLKSAAILMYQLQAIGMDPEFKEKRYQPNYNIIKEQAKSAGVISSNSFAALYGLGISDSDFDKGISQYALDVRDENDYFNTCSSTSDCYDYLRIFPGGKFSEQVKKKIEGFAFNESKTLEDLDKFISTYPNSKFDVASKKEEIVFNNSKTINEFRIYLSKYPNGRFRERALNKIDDLTFNNSKTNLELNKYLLDFPNGLHRQEAIKKIDDNDYFYCETINEYEKYLKDHPEGSHAAEARSKIEEEKFWLQCTKKNSWKHYKEYLNRFPKGKHASVARLKSKSPYERFNEWRGNNGCLFYFIIAVLIVLIITAIFKGVLGIGYIFGIIGIFGVFGSLGKGDIGCGTRIASLGIGIISGLIGYSLITLGEHMNDEKEVDNAVSALSSNPTLTEYKNFFVSYGNRLDQKTKKELLDKYYNTSLDSCYATINHFSTGYLSPADGWINTSGLGYLKEFEEKCKDSEYKEIATSKYIEIVDSLYEVANIQNTIEAWKEFQNSVSYSDYRDSKEKIESIEDIEWDTESKAWNKATTLDNLASYYKYIYLYPDGSHSKQANKKIIDLEVEQVMAGDYGELPALDQTSYGYGPTSTISVYNNTSYTLTLLYSGIESRKFTISPHGRSNITLKNGTYRCVASVNGGGVSNHAGTENLTGGSYDVEYYITTTRIPSYRKYK